MGQRIEADAKEIRAWKLQCAFLGTWYWLMLAVCLPTTLYLGYQGIAAILNGIRDWWHYREPEPSSGAWFWILVFVAAGIGWMYSLYAIDDYKQDRRFNEFVRARRADRKRWEEERARPRTKWEKFTGTVGLVYISLMGLMMLFVFILEGW